MSDTKKVMACKDVMIEGKKKLKGEIFDLPIQDYAYLVGVGTVADAPTAPAKTAPTK